MSTSANLQAGTFITSINGKRCTAVPRSNTASSSSSSGENSQQDTTTTTAAADAQQGTAHIHNIYHIHINVHVHLYILFILLDNYHHYRRTGTCYIAATSATAAQTATDQASQSAVALSDVTLSPSAGDASPLFTTIGTAAPTTGNGAAVAATDSATTGTVNTAPSSSSKSSTESTIAVAGGVIGGVAAISLIAFLIWFWRRRVLKKRRSTLLTPLSVDPAYRNEKGEGYVINRGSIGPTPRTEKIKAAVGANLRKLRGRMSQLVTRSGASTPTVNMNRGNSQFMEVSTHSRQNSTLLPSSGAEPTIKDRLLGWWTRKADNMNLGWRKDDDRTAQFARGLNEKRNQAPLSNKPDFLTLLNMDDRDLDREAQRRRGSRRGSRTNGSRSSVDHFLGGLSLNFGDDPFSDANATPHQSAKPAPLVVSQSDNPFNDSNAIPGQPAVPKPTTYVADIRRSRGRSVGAGGGGGSRPPSSNPGFGGAKQSIYAGRESLNSVDSFATRRNKFRSDPFDLEPLPRPSAPRVPSSNVSTAGGSVAGLSEIESVLGGRGVSGAVAGMVRKPVPAHARRESFSSKYSSGVSMGDWSDPGPDVGPATRWDDSVVSTPVENRRDDDELQGRPRRQSGGSQTSVGKAL
ncbi:hypothetical protein NKR23_g9952 [Pleurostoma richardsiae]|uniref:Uncharacterized protein n=1 Tax=Pleurostoma richardsiae TaxID=41990 RepID=A0AA38VJD2_9PEZI|nr:hypothetical protein NKR23_g9952 [Pleurostoma richardsiae]